MGRPTDWRNRIVGQGEVDPASLVPNPKNFRRHPARQRRVLSAVIEDVGFIQDVIVNRRTGRMLDGHLRVELAIAQKQPAIPVKYVDLAEHEEALVLATFDPVGALAYLDMEAMGHLRDVLANDAAEPIADLLEELAPPRMPDGDPREDEDVEADEEADELEQSYTMRLPGRVIPMTADEYQRLDAAFVTFLETRGMPFGFVRYLVEVDA